MHTKKSVNCSVMSDSAIPWTVAHQAPLSKEFSRQEYWSGWPFPPTFYINIPFDLADKLAEINK